jgi:hypothetical protein
MSTLPMSSQAGWWHASATSPDGADGCAEKING